MISESIHIWLSLMKNEKLVQFEDEIKKRFDQYCEPYMIVAYITDPRYQDEWPEMLTGGDVAILEEYADDWLNDRDVDGELMVPYLKFKKAGKDTNMFPSYMFKLAK